MMFSYLKNWLKIYLFYGILSFLLGFGGYIASDGGRTSHWTVMEFEGLKNFISTKIFDRSIKDPDIPAFSNQLKKVTIFTYTHQAIEPHLNKVVNLLQVKLKDHYLVESIPISSFTEWAHEVGRSPNIPWILLGLDQTIPIFQDGFPPRSDFLQDRLYLCVPEQFRDLIFPKSVTFLAARIKMFTIKRDPMLNNWIYEFQWSKIDNTVSLNDDDVAELLRVIVLLEYRAMTSF